MYGTKDTSQICEETCVPALEDIGFRRGRASPCCFWNPDLEISRAVHGGDFTAVGTRENLNYYEAELKKKFDLKAKGRWSTEKDADMEIRLLNRIIRLKEDGVHYEADPRHAELIIESLGVQGCVAAMPGAKEHHEVLREAVEASAADG